MQIHVYTLLVPLLLFLAAIFAASEASLFSLSRIQLESLRQTHPAIHLAIRRLIYRPEALLSTIIIGNEFLNILIGTFIAELFLSHNGELTPTFLVISSVVVSSILLLTFSEILPKILAFRMPIVAASILVYPMAWAHTVLTPFRKVFLAVSRKNLEWAGIRPGSPPVVSEKDFLTLVEEGAESGSLEKKEKELIFNVFHFSDLRVSSVMTHWKQVFAIDDTFSVEELLNLLKERPYSRIPVFSHTEKQVIGVLYTKELLKLLINPDPILDREALKRAIFPTHIVSTHKQVSKLFREFKFKKIHMALVVDEYGQPQGVITLEDILNALFHTPKQVEK